MAKQKESEGMTRTVLLAGLVIAATVGAMVMLSGDDKKAGTGASDNNGAAATETEDEVLRVSPVIVRDKIASASWRDRDTLEAEGDTSGSGSMLDTEMDTFGEDAAHDAKLRKSLAETVDEIHGLGVYVAPADDEDEKKK